MLTFLTNKLLKDCCTFGIGGPAKLYCEARSNEDLQEAIHFSKSQDLRYVVIGKGSNCLFDDRGFDGLVICNKTDFLHNPRPGVYHASAGYSFALLGIKTAKDGCRGLEFASGIPASVGGAVYMNAGANGSETGDFLVSVQYLHDEGNITEIQKHQLVFSYRSSSFQNMKGIILSATFSLPPSLEARKKQLEIVNYRTKTQPYGEKSAGCVFRNPPGYAAGALIERSGLKGMQIGEAKISELHANFIVNMNHAKTEDVLALMKLIKEKVKDKTGIELESEIKVIK